MVHSYKQSCAPAQSISYLVLHASEWMEIAKDKHSTEHSSYYHTYDCCIKGSSLARKIDIEVLFHGVLYVPSIASQLASNGSINRQEV